MRTAASVASSFIDETAYWVPRITGRAVRLGLELSDCSCASIWGPTQTLTSNAPRKQLLSRRMASLQHRRVCGDEVGGSSCTRAETIVKRAAKPGCAQTASR